MRAPEIAAKTGCMLTLIEGGDVYAPEPMGRQSILLVDGKIGKIGSIDRSAVEALGIDVDVIDATDRIVCPGIIDPHEHLLGGSGEEGFSTQTPEIAISEIVTAGITTVVGTLGVDTVMKTMAGLLAKVKGLKEEGISAYLWSGGYTVPAASIMRSVREDVMFIDEVIGAGEIAIADERSSEPSVRELASVVVDARVGGMLSGKAGLTHFHVGPGRRRLRCLRELLDSEEYEIDASWFYVTHVERSRALMREAVALASRGAAVDIDVQEEDLAKWIACYVEDDGDMSRLTISSDASKKGPATLLAQIRACVRGHRLPLAQLLSLVTSNTADILKLKQKGRIEVGRDGDLLVIDRDEFEIEHVLARGKFMVKGGELVIRERFLEGSNRRINLVGAEA